MWGEGGLFEEKESAQRERLEAQSRQRIARRRSNQTLSNGRDPCPAIPFNKKAPSRLFPFLSSPLEGGGLALPPL